jgi:ribosomal protein L19
MKKDLPELKIGMTVKVGVTVVEGNKTRVQPYQGLIIAMHKHALNSTITKMPGIIPAMKTRTIETSAATA